jgi:caffeoyl-CoA O-methyltransferase
MKDRLDAILRPEQAEYLESLILPRDPLMAEMERFASEHGIPISDPEVARLLEILARACSPKRILEVGTAIGYGALALARGALDAQVVTIERDPEQMARARDYLERAGVLGRVELLEGEALEQLARLEGPFDLAYFDAAKEEYRRYLDLVVPRLTVGGLVVADNALWKGKVAAPEEEEDGATRALRAFNAYLVMHPQLQATVLPVGDGLALAVKTRPTIMEMGGPY